MNDPLDRLEQAAERIVGRSEYEQQNRRGLLWIHAVIGLWGGIQMGLWGTAPNLELVTSQWVRYPMATLGFCGGFLVAFGLTRRPRSIPAEVFGLALLGVWDLAMTVGLGIARYRQGEYGVIGFGDPLPVGYVTGYPTTIYAGLFALICVHLWTLRNLSRARKTGAL